jgi:hypothetical protein
MTWLYVGCMNCLYICLNAEFEVLQMTHHLWVVHALSHFKFAIGMHSHFIGNTHVLSQLLSPPRGT